MVRFGVLLFALALGWGDGALTLRAGGVAYEIDPATIEIQARTAEGERSVVLPALIPAGEVWRRERDGSGWRWRDDVGAEIVIKPDGPNLSVTISRGAARAFAAALPTMAANDFWIVPDGEGIAIRAGDPFWRTTPGLQMFGQREQCMSATARLSMPAWSRIADDTAFTYMLTDGLGSQLCLKDDGGVIQGRYTHNFDADPEPIELLVQVREANLLAPAIAYRELLQRRGLFRSFADKPAPLLSRLYGAPHVWIWGDARRVEFLDQLRALGIEHVLLAADQGGDPDAGFAGPDYMARAAQLGFLAGPYEAFENAQPPETTDAATSNWGHELYPAGCIVNADGSVKAGFADRGCELSSEALRQRTAAPDIASRYEAHVRDGVTSVFVDVDAFGEFYRDYHPDHPMTVARDRENRLARLGVAMTRYNFVLGSEHVGAWSHGVSHYSQGTAQAHVVWRLNQGRERFGGWWPPQRPPFFLRPVQLTAEEARATFGPADRVPLFEAAFHDSIISTDRWNYPLMKLTGLERQRFAQSLLYGTPTMWSFDQRELARAAPWLRAAHDGFRRAHGWEAPVALTAFAWLTEDHLVQQTTFVDDRVIVANFTDAPWHGLGAQCVRVTWSGDAPFDVCPPEHLPPAWTQ